MCGFGASSGKLQTQKFLCITQCCVYAASLTHTDINFYYPSFPLYYSSHRLMSYSRSLYTILCLLLTSNPWKRNIHINFKYTLFPVLWEQFILISSSSLTSIAWESLNVPAPSGAIRGRGPRSFSSLYIYLPAPFLE